MRKEPLWPKRTTVLNILNGKVVEEAGKSEDLLEQNAKPSRTQVGFHTDLEDKKGTSPDRNNRSGDFYFRT